MHTNEKFPSLLKVENVLWCKGLHMKPILALTDFMLGLVKESEFRYTMCPHGSDWLSKKGNKNFNHKKWGNFDNFPLDFMLTWY
jgi:hypothetical protein